MVSGMAVYLTDGGSLRSRASLGKCTQCRMHHTTPTMVKMVMDVPKKMMEPKMPEFLWCHLACPGSIPGKAESLISSLLMLLAVGNAWLDGEERIALVVWPVVIRVGVVTVVVMASGDVAVLEVAFACGTLVAVVGVFVFGGMDVVGGRIVEEVSAFEAVTSFTQ